MSKPEYDVWAEIMLQEIYFTPEEHRVDYIKEQLLKAVRRGYTEGLELGWANEQEANPQEPSKCRKNCFACITKDL